MSKTKFRCLVGVEFFLIIAVWAGLIISAYDPAAAEEAAAQPHDQLTTSSLLILLVAIGAAILQMSGLIGLGLLKRWARHVYLFGVCLMVAISAVNGQSGGQPGWPSAIVYLLN